MVEKINFFEMEVAKVLTKNKVKGKVVQVLLPIIIGLSAIIGTLFTWHIVLRHENSQIEQLTESQLLIAKNELLARIDYKMSSLLRMAKRWEIQGGTPKEAWESDALFYLKHLRGFQSIEWVDRSSLVRWIVPLGGNEVTLDLNLLHEKKRSIALEKARATGEITITPAIDFAQGGKGFLGYVPVFKGKDFDGFIVGVFRFKTLFDAELKNITPGYSLAIFEDNEEIYRREVYNNLHEMKWGREVSVNLYGITWLVRVWPGSERFAQIRSYIPEYFLISGIFISILLAMLVYFVQTAQTRAKGINLVNRELMHEITEHKRVNDELTERMRLAAFIADVGIVVTQGKTLQNVLQGCATSMVKHLDAALARIWTLNKEDANLELRASAGMYAHIDGTHSRVPVGKFKIGLVAKNHKPYLTNAIIGDSHIHDQEWVKREGIVAFAGYPLIIEGSVVGVMAMFSKKQLKESTLEALGSVADTIALGIQQKHTEKLLRESEERFRTVVQTATDAIILAESSGNIISWNKGAQSIFGYSEEKVSGKSITPLMPERYRDAHIKGIERMHLTGKKKIIGKTIEVHGLRKDGSEFPMELSISDWKTGKGTFYTAIIRDITVRKRMEEELRVLSLVDELTGLNNRRGFLTLAGQQLKTANRIKRGMWLIFIDLDGLKRINDTLGHQEGDFALIDVANILKETFRESDISARIGGDEFVVLMMENTDTDGNIVHDRLQEKIDLHNKKRNRSFAISISVGITYYNPERPCSIDELLVQADKRMYEQKRGKQKG
ncbi:MAG: diguanylate cyclase [Candidatus Jettenia sp.]|uniref:Two-component sensor kinase n=1 Tax=Candidatus Jettenia caeni TaxID=247490 RepID=I3IP94_9BACT|nr:diguanylate cyclase [Candidatus Jettenia sp. AMX1]MBC6929746.1 diguanylate cyclase [Candidatus Jettenia sp.]WKZ15993.1 MAG: diguanylate cyclase [Candidatus Jettenia caeni]KAA0248715.1 MAG: diguanylate cyclase [Candidatus Jettenia sp. AMX1]MCE7880662.1 diguanylate cyclase [Candidatus Jettenia sp. AMX1]MCQ3927406.1 diguanylate cyclase [Candidatus Jettenia sp.]